VQGSLTVNGTPVQTSSVDITSLNAFTASQETKDLTLASVTSSLNSATASLFTSASNALVTASVSGQLLTFNKGNNSQFTLTLPTGSGTYVTGSFGSFHDETTQSGSANTPNIVKFSNTDLSQDVFLSGSSALKVGSAGVYNLQFSLQVKRVSGSGTDTIDIWFRKNGSDIDWSNTTIGLDGGVEATRVVPAWNFMESMEIGDYLEILWQSTDDNIQLISVPASGSLPSIPSVIATMQRVDVGGGSNMVTTSSFNAYTSSNDQKVNSLINATGSYATTGSNTFRGAQTINLSGTAQIFASSIVGNATRVETDMYVDGGNYDTFNILLSASAGLQLRDYDFTNDVPLPFISVGTDAGELTLHRNTNISGNLDIQSTLTASLQEGYVWAGGAGNVSKLVATSSFIDTINTGSFATTGSNNFVGTQYISSSNGIAIVTTGSIKVAAGSLITSSRVDVENTIEMGDGSYFRFLSGSSYYNMQLNPTTGAWSFSRSGVSNTKTLQLAGYEGANTTFESNPVVFADTTTQVTFNTPARFNNGINNNLQITGSLTVFGSNTFIGSQTITGSLVQSGSNTIASGPLGALVGNIFNSRVLISGGTTGTTTPILYISGSDGAYTQLSRNLNLITTVKRSGVFDSSGQFYANTSSVAGQYIGVYDDPNFNTDVELAFRVTKDGSSFSDWDNGSVFDYIPFMTLEPNLGDNPPPQFKRSIAVTGSVSITEVMNLKAQNPLPTGNIGDLAVSGSHLYFYNGAWTQLD
jgi:hypothetical protein